MCVFDPENVRVLMAGGTPGNETGMGLKLAIRHRWLFEVTNEHAANGPTASGKVEAIQPINPEDVAAAPKANEIFAQLILQYGSPSVTEVVAYDGDVGDYLPLDHDFVQGTISEMEEAWEQLHSSSHAHAHSHNHEPRTFSDEEFAELMKGPHGEIEVGEKHAHDHHHHGHHHVHHHEPHSCGGHCDGCENCSEKESFLMIADRSDVYSHIEPPQEHECDGDPNNSCKGDGCYCNNLKLSEE
jgi:hypothetical protein